MYGSDYEMVFPWWFKFYESACKFFAGVMQVECQMDARKDWIYKQALLRSELVHKSNLSNKNHGKRWS